MDAFVDQLAVWLAARAEEIWTVMVPVLFGVGLLLSIRIGFLQFGKLGTALRFGLGKAARTSSGREGDVTPFAALSTALAATVGNGNIAGVATALMWGGPGALFWMWGCGFLGMATKYSEAMLGVRYRQKHPDGSIAGGPMYYIRYGLNDTSFARGLAGFFAVCGAFAALFGTGNMMQSNQISLAINSEFGVPMWITGAVITVLTALVILGGLKRIASVTEKLVPAMIVLYIGFGTVVLLLNVTHLPGAFWLIFENAFTPTAATGGFLGATMMQGVQFGARRGILSNEAGLGSAPIAHAAAQTPSPITQGLVGVMEVFIDTIVVCTFTGLILMSTGLWTSGLAGSAMTAAAFSGSIPVVGGLVVALSSFLFGYSTLIGWSYYGEQCLQYLFGVSITLPYRIVFIALTFIGAVVSIEVVFFVGDIANAFMALPNLIGLTLLSGIVARMTREGLATDPIFRKNAASAPTR
ncbi:MAG: alanine:cation symporter family protein [Acidobacteria bacterium]|nr:MAG: alanine:cation symporter family protein [Acidobacteriota bacterium]